MLAFREAVACGTDLLELDVQLSRDGTLVVMHDQTLERTTNGRGRVPDHTLAELRDTAVELEECRVWACAAAVEATGTDRALVEARLDGVLSTPRFLKEVAGADLVVV